jgi:hypothetical protein
VETAVKDADDFDLTVEDVSLAGARATARVKSRERDAERVRTLELVREGGNWRVSGLG